MEASIVVMKSATFGDAQYFLLNSVFTGKDKKEKF